jgi:hypothetical protein
MQMTTQYVIVRDGQTTWVADRTELLAAMDKLGWQRERRGGLNVAIEPDFPPEQEHEGEEAIPYAKLCRAVAAVNVEPNDIEMGTCDWSDCECAWLLFDCRPH